MYSSHSKEKTIPRERKIDKYLKSDIDKSGREHRRRDSLMMIEDKGRGEEKLAVDVDTRNVDIGRPMEEEDNERHLERKAER